MRERRTPARRGPVASGAVLPVAHVALERLVLGDVVGFPVEVELALGAGGARNVSQVAHFAK